MKLQDSKANCGPTALANALEAMGQVRSVGELSTLCKTTATRGTSPRNILSAVVALKESCDLDDHACIQARDPLVAAASLFKALAAGRVCVLLVDSDEHYVAAVGLLGCGRYLVVDSADEALLVSCTEDELCAWWKGCGRYPYWAVVL